MGRTGAANACRTGVKRLFFNAGMGFLLLGAALLAGAVVVFVGPPVYEATVRCKLEKSRLDGGAFLDENGSQPEGDSHWMQVQLETIRSKNVLHQVITNLHLNKKWAEKRKSESDLSMTKTYSLLRKQIRARQIQRPGLVEVSVRSEDPVEAANIANWIASVFRDTKVARVREFRPI